MVLTRSFLAFPFWDPISTLTKGPNVLEPGSHHNIKTDLAEVIKVASLLPYLVGTFLCADLSAKFILLLAFLCKSLSFGFDATSSSWFYPAGLAASSQPLGNTQDSFLGLLLFSCDTLSLSNSEHQLSSQHAREAPWR